MLSSFNKIKFTRNKNYKYTKIYQTTIRFKQSINEKLVNLYTYNILFLVGLSIIQYLILYCH